MGLFKQVGLLFIILDCCRTPGAADVFTDAAKRVPREKESRPLMSPGVIFYADILLLCSCAHGEPTRAARGLSPFTASLCNNMLSRSSIVQVGESWKIGFIRANDKLRSQRIRIGVELGIDSVDFAFKTVSWSKATIFAFVLRNYVCRNMQNLAQFQWLKALSRAWRQR